MPRLDESKLQYFAVGLLLIGALLAYAVYRAFVAYVITPLPLFVQSLIDNWQVAMVFAGALAAWLVLHRLPSKIAQVCSSMALPVTIGVSPYILLFYWFSLTPVTAAFVLASGAAGYELVASALTLHRALEWGVWILPLTGIVIIVAVQFNSSALLKGFARVRSVTGALGIATIAFGSFSAMKPPDIGTWQGPAMAELRVELKPQLLADAKALALKQIADTGGQSQSLQSRLVEIQQQAQLTSQLYAKLTTSPPGEQVIAQASMPVEDLGRTCGARAADTLPLSPAQGSSIPGDLAAPAKDLMGGAIVDAVLPSWGNGLAGIFINSAGSMVAERLVDRLLAVLPIDRMLAMIRDPKLVVSTVAAAIQRFDAASITPTDSELADLRSSEEGVRNFLIDVDRAKNRRSTDVGSRQLEAQRAEEWQRLVQKYLSDIKDHAK